MPNAHVCVRTDLHFAIIYSHVDISITHGIYDMLMYYFHNTAGQPMTVCTSNRNVMEFVGTSAESYCVICACLKKLPLGALVKQ